MPYTDNQGRPEIVAGKDLKLGPAAVRIVAAPDAAADSQPAGGDDAYPGGEAARPVAAEA